MINILKQIFWWYFDGGFGKPESMWWSLHNWAQFSLVNLFFNTMMMCVATTNIYNFRQFCHLPGVTRLSSNNQICLNHAKGVELLRCYTVYNDQYTWDCIYYYYPLYCVILLLITSTLAVPCAMRDNHG